MAEVVFWREAEKDYRQLDGSLQQWTDAAVERLQLRGSEIGKPLRNNSYSKLSGFKELKNHKLGIRLIFKPVAGGAVEIIEIAAIGSREDGKVFKEIEKRRRDR
ncbi:type II toxin-antitoxin system RelE family toxin [Indiicoccus explosivorum]|uniref:type II toxin-antitoxin system RelE family toxin n=1 Tax=Indiicoccus explosivorum TaxID=1917864 RepID=UPI000B451A1C|nr:addiction module toxin RelE [Indiicoccus explosivorum]